MVNKGGLNDEQKHAKVVPGAEASSTIWFAAGGFQMWLHGPSLINASRIKGVSVAHIIIRRTMTNE